MWSHYKFHLQFINHDEMNNPEKNIELFKKIISKPWFIRNSYYSQNIKRMKKNLSENEMKIFYLDDISEKPNEMLKEIEDFVGINNYDYSSLELKSRKNTSIKKDIPTEWLNIMEEILYNEYKMLYSMGLTHENW